MKSSNNNLPIDKGWAWVIVIGGFFNTFLMVGIAKSFGLLVEEFIRTFEVSTAMATMVISVSGIVYAFCAPLCIVLGEHFTARRVVMLGGLIALIGISISSLLISMTFVICFMGVGFGIGNSAVYGNSLVMVGQYFRKRRTLANGITVAGASIGQFTLPPLIQFLVDTYSLSGTLLILSAIYFNVTVCGSLFRPTSFYLQKSHNIQKSSTNNVLAEEVQNEVSDPLISNSLNAIKKDVKLRALMASTGSIMLEEEIEIEDSNDINQDEKDNSSRTSSTKCFCQKIFDFSVLVRPIIMFYVIIAFLSFFGYFNFILFLPLHVISKGITKYDKALLISICGVGDLIGRLGSGYFGDLNLIARYKIKAIAVIFVGIVILLFLVADNFTFLAVLSALYGFFGGVYINYIAIVLIDFVGLKIFPKALALVLLLQGSGAAAGQPFLGWIRDVTGSFEVVIIICGVLPIIGGILLLCYPLIKKRDKQTHLDMT
ncbi:hypothetical protein LOTGIDRAFT_119991 [Lottia gigantea]|uniref:Major facilitator superfamily (MFS) profile domain-containing protein n=1 Tax=Lottia gigantea TaxID=225164 RepID=V4A835_LOTGI|nr:hypothetical protein LOTGIDRAFT_119991 [Lottia gigantea]ESO92867.1 hypothetical protein LOTGIDRAFT_119991 [Lottia gigantea]